MNYRIQALADARIPVEIRTRAADAALALVNAEVARFINVTMRDWPTPDKVTDVEKDELAIAMAAYRAAHNDHRQAWIALASHIRKLEEANKPSAEASDRRVV